MSSKKYLLILILLVAAAVGLYVLRGQKLNSHKNTEDFYIENPDKVEMIFMTNLLGDKQIFLKKSADGNWTVNDSFPANKKEVDFLLNGTMAKLRTTGPVPNAAKQNIIKAMAIDGIKVEIYENGKNPIKTYIVGGTTPSLLGTYFKNEGNVDPKIVAIPGEEGFVNIRYSLDLDNWISRTIFDSKRLDIEEVEVIYGETPLHGFKMVQNSDGNIDFTAEKFDEKMLNGAAVKSYLNNFELKNFEGFIYANDSLKDSLLKTTPYCTIRLKSKNRGVDELKFYRKKSYEKMHGLYDSQGNQLAYDPDRFYGIYNKLGRVLIVQDYTFSKNLRSVNNFLLTNPE
ncbi:MAG: DUF4340 domain-containing protein [Flavobacteriales bacterium]|nr:DUF4340 domain-containing protein [Flavobacteriales bacterium]